jgi:hypothetical protein
MKDYIFLALLSVGIQVGQVASNVELGVGNGVQGWGVILGA